MSLGLKPVCYQKGRGQISDRLDFLFLAFLQVYHWLSKLLA